MRDLGIATGHQRRVELLGPGRVKASPGVHRVRSDSNLVSCGDDRRAALDGPQEAFAGSGGEGGLGQAAAVRA